MLKGKTVRYGTVRYGSVDDLVYSDQWRESDGRGGTDLRPPLSDECVGELRPDVAVYFTDGDGKAPDRPLPWPIIWVLTPGGRRPAPWGEVIELKRASWSAKYSQVA